MRMKGKKKVRDGLLLAVIIAISLGVAYFGGGYLAGLFVPSSIFSGRQSEKGKGEKSFASLTYDDRDDFPSLSFRKEVAFPSGGNSLKGYFYQAEEAKGTFLFAHGLHGHSDDATAMVQDWIYRQGFSVFAIDLTASGGSEGEGISSLAQGAYDVKAALEYLFAQTDFFAPMGNLYLCGYSWGAYSAAASLNFDYPFKISGVLCFSGFETPEGEMIALARNYVGFLADMNALTLDWGMATRVGEDRFLSASQGILSSGAKAYLVHGGEDSTVPLGASVYQCLDEGEKVKKKIKEGFGHVRPWVEASSRKKSEDLEKRCAEQGLEEYGKALSGREKEEANRIDEETMREAISFLAGETKES